MDCIPPGSCIPPGFCIPPGISRQAYWSGLPFPSPGDLPNPGIRLQCSALQVDFFTDWATREACISEVVDIFPAILIPAWDSSSLAFCMTYSATGNKGLFQICKGVHPGCLLSPCLFNLCGISIMKRGKLKREASIYTQSKDVTQKELCHCPIPSSGSQTSEGLFIGWCRNWNRGLQDSIKKLILFETDYGKFRASLVAQMVKNMSAMQENGFYPRVGNIPWRRNWQPTPILLPRNFHERRSSLGYSQWDHKISHNWETMLSLHFTWEGQA